MGYVGKVVVVTGGGSGLGRALCGELAARGASVVAADLDAAAAEATAADVSARGGKARAETVDVTDSESVRALLERVADALGRVDIMVNGAGVTVIGEMRDLSLDHWRRVLDVNLWGVVHGTHHAYARMLAQGGGGHIVNIASGFGLAPGPANAPYTASKWAVVGLTESLRAEGLDLGVHASVVCPGLIRTPMIDRLNVVGGDREQFLKTFPFAPSEPEWAARKIADGVDRGKAVITFPFSVRLIVWLYRRWPRIAFRVGLKMIREMRAVRRVEGAKT